MPLPDALTVQDQERIRDGMYNAERYAIVFNGNIMMQFSPDANASGKSNSEISYTTIDSGGIANVINNMTVIVSPTSDYIGDLQDTPDSVLITYVRKSPTASLLFIGETAFQWTTSSVVTVLSEWRVHEKRTIISGTTIFKNISVLRQNPRPRIFDLFDDIVVTSAPNVNYSPTPNATAMTSGATISSWSWDVIENGVVSKNASSSQNPTFDLDIGKHWLILTATDNAGLTHALAVKVAIVPRNFDSVVENALVDAIDYDMSSGGRAGIDKFDDSSLIVPGAPCLIMTHIDYTNGITEDYVDLSGWLGGEVALELSGDEQWGQLKTYADSVFSIRRFAEAIRLSAFPVREKSSPSVWGEMTRSGIYDAIWYITSEHSTLANVASQDYPSDFANYRFPSIDTPGGTLPDILDALSFRASGDMINYSPNGEMIFAKSLFYETTDANRDSAVVYGLLTIDDSESIFVQRNSPGLFGLSIMLAGFATFNTATSKPRIYHSQSPAGFVPSVLLEELDGIIMLKDLSNSDAKAQAGKFTANHFFAATDAIEVQGDFISGYRLCPRGDAWVKLTLAAIDTLDGSMFDTNTRFVVTRLSSRLDTEQGFIVNSATLRKETTGGDNYANETAFVPIGTVQTIPTFPVQNGYPDLSDYEDMSDTYGDDYDDYRDGWEDVGLPPEDAAGEGIPSTIYDDTIYIPMTGNVINSNIAPDSGTNNVAVRVSGSGRLADVWCFEWLNGATDDMTANAQFGCTSSITSTQVVGCTNQTDTAQATNVTITFASPVTITKVSFDISIFRTRGGTSKANIQVNGGSQYSEDILDGDSTHTINSTFTNVSTVTIGAFASSNVTGTSPDSEGAFSFIQSLVIEGLDSNPVAADNCNVDAGDTLGDAFYFDFQDGGTAQAYSGQGGLNVDGNGIAHGQDYDSSHVYEFLINGTGAVLGFSFLDTFDDDLSNNENVNLKVELKEL